jgi:DNA polymerase-3 subunit epsilon
MLPRANSRKAGSAASTAGASAKTAQLALDALHETFPIRQCTRRLPLVAPTGASACVLAELGRCSAPCIHHQVAPDYAAVVEQVRHAMLADADPVVGAHAARIDWLVEQERFEEAATVRDRLGAFLRGASRAQRFAPLSACPELVAARRTDDGGWELVLVRYGRLAGTARVDRRTDPRPVIATLQASGEHVEAPVAPAPAAHPEETDLVLTWLDQPGVRLVEVATTWAYPLRSAQRLRDPAAAVATVTRTHPPAIVLHPAETRGERPPAVLTGDLDEVDAQVIPLSIRRPRTA